MRQTPGASPPDEAIIINMAEKFGIPPWEFEEKCTGRWWGWIVAYYAEYAEARKNGGRKNKIHR